MTGAGRAHRRVPIGGILRAGRGPGTESQAGRSAAGADPLRSVDSAPVRIISGEQRGRRLRAPEGLATRPTSDRVREALFNILSTRIQGANFLDVCAGSGAVGLEALSRGAERAVFVEQSRRALEYLESNIEACGFQDRSRIVPKDAVSALKALIARDEQFDVVYVDPPYEADLYAPILQLLGLSGLVAPEGIVVVERRSRDRLPAEAGVLRHYRDVRHGNSTLAFYERD